MDSNSSLILINLIMNLLVVIDHFLTKIKRSICWGGELEMMNTDNKDNKENQININKNDLIEQLKILTNQKQLDEKSNDKKDDPLNKL